MQELNFDTIKEVSINIINAPAATRHVEFLAEMQGNKGVYAFDVLGRLYELEAEALEITTEQCNTGEDGGEDRLLEILHEVQALLPLIPKDAIFINHDPRGYALKIKDDYLRDEGIRMWTDFGGYGILAPNFS